MSRYVVSIRINRGATVESTVDEHNISDVLAALSSRADEDESGELSLAAEVEISIGRQPEAAGFDYADFDTRR